MSSKGIQNGSKRWLILKYDLPRYKLSFWSHKYKFMKQIMIDKDCIKTREEAITYLLCTPPHFSDTFKNLCECALINHY